MDWKAENPKPRYIDSLTYDEAKQLAFLAAGQPDDFELTRVEARCNGNNIPHVELHFRYWEPLLGSGEENYIGIFHNLNTYYGRGFKSVYCQRELFAAFAGFGLE